jgi:hypothetical protein
MSSYFIVKTNEHGQQRISHPSFFFATSYSPVIRHAPSHFSFASAGLGTEELPAMPINRGELPIGTPESKRPDIDPRQLDFGRRRCTASAAPAAPVAAAALAAPVAAPVAAAALAAPVAAAVAKRRAMMDGHAKPCNCKLDCLSKFSQREIDDRRWWLKYCLTDRKRHEACFHELITASTVISPGKRKVNPT